MHMHEIRISKHYSNKLHGQIVILARTLTRLIVVLRVQLHGRTIKAQENYVFHVPAPGLVVVVSHRVPCHDRPLTNLMPWPTLDQSHAVADP